MYLKNYVKHPFKIKGYILMNFEGEDWVMLKRLTHSHLSQQPIQSAIKCSSLKHNGGNNMPFYRSKICFFVQRPCVISEQIFIFIQIRCAVETMNWLISSFSEISVINYFKSIHELDQACSQGFHRSIEAQVIIPSTVYTAHTVHPRKYCKNFSDLPNLIYELILQRESCPIITRVMPHHYVNTFNFLGKCKTPISNVK